MFTFKGKCFKVMTQVLRNQHPTLNEIHQMMKERIFIPDKVVDGLVYKCAEVAESIMMDAVLKTGKKIVTIQTVKSVPKLELNWSKNGCGRYLCSCGNRSIYGTHNFCNACGIEIKWLNRETPKWKKRVLNGAL